VRQKKREKKCCGSTVTATTESHLIGRPNLQSFTPVSDIWMPSPMNATALMRARKLTNHKIMADSHKPSSFSAQVKKSGELGISEIESGIASRVAIVTELP